MKELLVLGVFILFLTGAFYVIRERRPEHTVVVGFTYFLGFLGLHSIYKSISYNDAQLRWLTLLFGFMSVLIAYFTLEALL